MEDSSPLFSLSIDPATKAHLSDTAKWARFLAIIGFIFLVFMIGSGIIASMRMNSLEERYAEQFGNNKSIGRMLGATALITYIIVAIIWFFPLLYLLRFSNKMRAAIAADDQGRLNASFENLKLCFRYLGIVTIIGLVFLGLSMFLGVISRV